MCTTKPDSLHLCWKSNSRLMLGQHVLHQRSYPSSTSLILKKRFNIYVWVYMCIHRCVGGQGGQKELQVVVNHSSGVLVTELQSSAWVASALYWRLISQFPSPTSELFLKINKKSNFYSKGLLLHSTSWKGVPKDSSNWLHVAHLMQLEPEQGLLHSLPLSKNPLALIFRENTLSVEKLSESHKQAWRAQRQKNCRIFKR